MAAKMIEQLGIGYMSFCTSYTVMKELDTKKSRGGKFGLRNGCWSRRGAYNEILNELRLNEF